MAPLTELRDYTDDRGNLIESPERSDGRFSVTFAGSGNRLTIHPQSRLTRLTVVFHGDGGVVEIGHNRTKGTPSLLLRVGGGSAIRIGDNVSTTSTLFASAVEGASITIRDDVMIASHVQVRTDDSHGIYDVTTGARINPAQDIVVGQHVWLGYDSVVLGGVHIGAGSVLGIRSIATRDIPNNCVAAGAPARVVRRDIAWERPYLWLSPGPRPWPGFDAANPPPHWRRTAGQPAGGLPRRRRSLSALARRLRRRLAR